MRIGEERKGLPSQQGVKGSASVFSSRGLLSVRLSAYEMVSNWPITQRIRKVSFILHILHGASHDSHSMKM